jgi:hypothetical protein
MKFAPFAALGLAVVAVPAAAQTAAPAAPAAPVALAAAAAFSVDTPIEALVADARSKAVLDKYLPGIDGHPAYEQFKSLSLSALAPFSQGMITDDVLTKVAADLAAIK